MPKLYTGSGTNADHGVDHRFRTYDKASRGELTNQLPSNVKKSLEEGFKITSKGLLVTAPLPKASSVPMVRCLLIALESALTFMLWTLVVSTSTFGGKVAMCL
jgi:hypothetical protein